MGKLLLMLIIFRQCEQMRNEIAPNSSLRWQGQLFLCKERERPVCLASWTINSKLWKESMKPVQWSIITDKKIKIKNKIKIDSRDSIRTTSSIGVRRSTTDQAKIKYPSVFVSAGGKGVKSLRKTPWPKNTIANSSNWVNGQFWKKWEKENKKSAANTEKKRKKKQVKGQCTQNLKPKIHSDVYI